MSMVLLSYETQSIEGESRIVACTADELHDPNYAYGPGGVLPGSSSRTSNQATTRITIVVDVNDEQSRRLRELLEALMRR